MTLRRRAGSAAARLLARPRPPASTKVLVAMGATCAVVAIGGVDVATGADLTLGVFYLLPVALATIVVGTGTGISLAVMSSLTGLVADEVRRGSATTPAHLTNSFLRFSILLVTVTLLAGLRAALDRLRESDQRSREFLAFAAHQLRTPVAGVRAAAEALVIEGASPVQERLLRRVMEESARSSRLVASLLQVARLDQGEVHPERECDIRALLDEVGERVQARAPQLVVEVQVDPSIPCRAHLSPEATREMLENILDNTRRHAASRIGIVVSSEPDALRLAIEDDGPGLPPGREDLAFERLVSLDGLGGSGLGLPIARGLAERQGGTLEFENGAFVLSLPLREPASAKPARSK